MYSVANTRLSEQEQDRSRCRWLRLHTTRTPFHPGPPSSGVLPPNPRPAAEPPSTPGAECVDLLHRWARVEHVPEGAESAGGATEGAGGAPAAGGPLTAAEVKAVSIAYHLSGHGTTVVLVRCGTVRCIILQPPNNARRLRLFPSASALAAAPAVHGCNRYQSCDISVAATISPKSAPGTRGPVVALPWRCSPGPRHLTPRHAPTTIASPCAFHTPQLLKSVPPDVAEGLTRAAEAPTAPSVREAEAALDAAAAAVGVRAKKLDKKGEHCLGTQPVEGNCHIAHDWHDGSSQLGGGAVRARRIGGWINAASTSWRSGHAPSCITSHIGLHTAKAKSVSTAGEKAALAALRERLMAALAAETDPPAALAVMVPLAHLRVAGECTAVYEMSLVRQLQAHPYSAARFQWDSCSGVRHTATLPYGLIASGLHRHRARGLGHGLGPRAWAPHT